MGDSGGPAGESSDGPGEDGDGHGDGPGSSPGSGDGVETTRDVATAEHDAATAERDAATVERDAGRDAPLVPRARADEGIAWLVDPDEGRLRAAWRLLIGLSLLTVALVVGTAGRYLLHAVGATTGVLGAATAGVGWAVYYLAALGAIAGAAVWIDHRTLPDLGLGGPRWWANLGFGAATGVAMVAAVFAVELALGVVAVEGVLVSHAGAVPADASVDVLRGVEPGSVWLSLAVTLVFVAGVALVEEALIRGYMLVNLAEGLSGLLPGGARGAVAVAAAGTSLLFGAAHLANEGATALGTLNIAAIGLFLAAAFVATGDLGVPVGIHFGWNFALGSVFGYPVSGVPMPATVLDVSRSGPRLLTGGPFGPEAGLVAYVGLAVGVALTAAWLHLTGSEWDPDGVARPTLRGGRADATSE